MNDGIGVDIVEFEEIRAHLNAKFVTRVLSIEEMAIYDTMNTDKRRLEFLGGRFAAKEAYTKAYGSFETPLNFNEVSILKGPNGKPYVKSVYRAQDTVLISISHSKQYVVAICHLEKKERE
jgi:holo-[acyl-carrier protein] synthase